MLMEMAHWRSGGREGDSLGELGMKGVGSSCGSGLGCREFGSFNPINLTTGTPRRHEWKASSLSSRRTLVGKHTDFPYLEPS